MPAKLPKGLFGDWDQEAGETKKKAPIPLPTLPTNILQWIEAARPMVGGIVRTFDWEPFWPEVYEDNSPNIIVVNGRQTFKSTFGTDLIGCYSTSHDNVEVTYVMDRLEGKPRQAVQLSGDGLNPLHHQVTVSTSGRRRSAASDDEAEPTTIATE